MSSDILMEICCFSKAKSRLSIYAGTLRKRADSKALVYVMDDYHMKEGYTDVRKDDILLIRVTSDIVFSDLINIIQLPTENYLKAGDEVTAAGWGHTTVGN